MAHFKFNLLLAFFLSIFLFSCKNEKGPVPFQVTDNSIFSLVQQTAGSGYYKSGDTLAPAGNSPHGLFRLRMNSNAQSVLNNLGELPGGKSFPDSSLIVKEIITPGPIQYAVMYKSGNSWSWAEFKGNGETYYSVTQNGRACISCHSASPNRDLIRTFDLH